MFSVVIITKNEETYVPLLLESIRTQTLQPNEVIIADAGSTDRTREIATSYGCRVVEGGLPSTGRNRGADAASGSHLLFLDADVELRDPRFLEQAWKEIQDRNLDFATCDVEPISDRPLDHVVHGFYNHYVRLVKPVIKHAPGFCIFARKHTHDAIGGFDETIRFCEDHDYIRRGCHSGTFDYLERVKIPVSVRRLDRDGRLTIAVKYTLGELHLLTLGPVKHDLFRYSFGHPPKSKP